MHFACMQCGIAVGIYVIRASCFYVGPSPIALLLLQLRPPPQKKLKETRCVQKPQTNAAEIASNFAGNARTSRIFNDRICHRTQPPMLLVF